MAPFQVTVLVPTVATAVPDVALALTSVSAAGRTSVNSLPGLSACGLPVVGEHHGVGHGAARRKVPETVLVPVTRGAAANAAQAKWVGVTISDQALSVPVSGAAIRDEHRPVALACRR